MDDRYLIQQVEKAGGICLRLSPFSRAFAVFIPTKFLGSTNRYPVREFAPARAVIVQVDSPPAGSLFDPRGTDGDMMRFDKTGFELWILDSEKRVDAMVRIWFGGTDNVVR